MLTVRDLLIVIACVIVALLLWTAFGRVAW